MQVSVESTSDLERRLTVEISRAEIDTKIEDRLNTLKDQVTVEGFRPGKVPLDVVRSKYGAQVQNEVYSETIQNTLQQALGEQQLEPVSEPSVQLDDTSPDNIFRFSASFEVIPAVEIQPVNKIKLTRPVVEITEADVDKLQENLLKQRMQWQPANGAAVDGNRVTISYNGTIDGNAFGGSSANDLQVVIGEGSLPAGFEEQLVGLAAGSTNTISITIPDTFNDVACRGKTAQYEVTVSRIETPELPDLDERFFRSFGITEGGYDKFRAQLRNNMEIELKNKLLGTVKNDMLDQLLELHPVTVPESLLKSEAERMKNAGESGAGMQDADYMNFARHRIACGIILTQLGKELGISASPEQVREQIEYIAQTYENPEEVIAWYYSSQEQLSSVEAMVAEELLVGHVLEHGQVTDKPMSFTELMES